ncbi:L-gulonolactone oxidase [Micromonospora viridifaciens]|uniref:L-gulonolactone oxidase n=1 Tax=Micromonospora viridifaciens TaxID=1881 RepID=A0A1C5A2G5_MICVI|nr:D-arabinono-1,4-lactone oxidase [Micromonospora viridifaciens]SCE64993.1 L-gulonolactone oxidase [Micromonospora viridifaciens]SCF39281.1 L-gulonolactone oxidase [Micromonospora viridifaciens]
MAGTPAAWSNWAGNQRSIAARVARPRTVDEVVEAVQAAADAGRTIRAVGSGHSFAGAALTDGYRLDLADLATGVTVDTARRLVTVPAGMTLHALNDLLAAHGLALPNLGDIDAQTVAGALSTGTHGTGGKLGCLSTFVTGLTLVTGTGEVLHCSADAHRDVFAAARVGLGAVGVLVEVTLRCVDAFVLRAHERPAPLDSVLADLPGLVEQHDHVEFYWFPYTARVQVKTNDRVPDDDRPLPRWRGWLDDDFLANTAFGGACWLGRAVPALAPGISAVSARALTERTYTGRSDRVFCTPRRVRFVEMEYALPRAAMPEALAALRRIVDRLPFKVLFPVEVRFTAADDIWLSHGYGRDSAYLAIHQYVGMPFEPYFRAFEEVATELGGRPHWGKLHYRDAASLRPAYPRFADFLAVRDRLDPNRLFSNPYLTHTLGP